MRFIFLTLVVLLFTMLSCDIIDESQRLIEVPQVPANKTVLLVEFTDQRCVNCPAAAALVEGFHEEFDEKLISVSMHANPIYILPLETETSNLYENFFQVTQIGHPAAFVDRSTNLSPLMESWNTLIRNEIQKEAKIDISISTKLDTITGKLTVYSAVRGINLSETEATDLNLQLWITEDSIVSRQLMSNAVYNYNYIHRHVFRAAINEAWGQPIQLQTGEIVNDTVTYTLPQTWNTKQLSVVGFVYAGNNFANILQSTNSKIKK